MLLFSGAVFIILAGTIRAITILTVSSSNTMKISTSLELTPNPSQSGPEGAVSGSLWACRETFVAIVVSNLPIIHPLLRKLAKVVGLGALLSRNTNSRSQSYPLQSNVGIEHQKNSSRKSRSHHHPLSVGNDTMWASDEHILPVGVGGGRQQEKSNGGIVVAQEVSVKTEMADERGGSSPDSGRLRGDDWAVRNMVSVGGNTPPKAHRMA